MRPWVDLLLRHPWRWTALMAAVTALALAGFPRFRLDLTNERLFYTRDPEVERHRDFLATFGRDDNLLVALVEAPDVFAPEALQAQRRLAGAFAGAPELEEVASLELLGAPSRAEALASPLLRGVLVNERGTAAVVSARVRLEEASDLTRARAVDAARAAVAAERARGTSVHLGGLPLIQRVYAELILHDLVTYFPLVVPVFALVLLAVFRSFHGVAVPLAAVGTGVLWTLGAMWWADVPMNILNHVLPTLIFVVGIADAIHLVARYHEEASGAADRREAVRRAVSAVGAACLMTTLTSMVGFASLGVIAHPIIQEFGLWAGVGLALAYGVTLSFVPLALVLVPQGEPRSGRVPDERGGLPWLERRLGALARFVVRHPGAVLVASAALGAAGLAGTARLEVRSSALEELFEDHPVAVDNRAIEEALGGVFSLEMRVSAPLDERPLVRPDVLEGLARLAEELEAQESPVVSRVISLADALREATLRLVGGPPELPRNEAALGLLLEGLRAAGGGGPLARLVTADGRQLRVSARVRSIDTDTFWALVRRTEARAARLLPAGVRLEVTGTGVLVSRAIDDLIWNMIQSVGVALVAIAVLLCIEFRSLSVGFLAMLPNVLPLLVATGVMGFAGIPLRFSTVMIFSIALGIAVDDTIHFIARFREELARGEGDWDRAVVRTTEASGRAIVTTSVLLVAGFGTLALSEFVASVQFALLTGVVLTVAVVADLMMTPALFLWARPRGLARGAGGPA